MFRLLVFAVALVSAAAPAIAIDPSEVAPPGVCAGEEPPEPGVQAAPPSPDRGVELAFPALPASLLLSPQDVASGGAAVGLLGIPATSIFPGPGACDTPGSGCAGGKVFDDPDPGTGCGFPGSPCP